MWRHHAAWAPPEVTRDKRGIADLSASTRSPTADSRDTFTIAGTLALGQRLFRGAGQGGIMIADSFGRYAVRTAHDHENAPPEGSAAGLLGRM